MRQWYFNDSRIEWVTLQWYPLKSDVKTIYISLIFAKTF